MEGSSFGIFWVTTLLKVLLLPHYRSTDFEVHRNWLAITHSLPVSQWYFEATSPWTLDYPPFFAWFEYALSLVAARFDPAMLDVANLMYASPATVLFQRLSVVATDAVLFLAILHYTRGMSAFSGLKDGDATGAARQRWIVTLLAFTNPGLMIVDHIHFQYNGVLLGVFLWSASHIQRGQDLRGALLFAALLCLKHIFIYAAPAYFVYLLRHYCFDDLYAGTFRGWEQFNAAHADRARPVFRPAKFLLLAASVLGVFGAALGPFLAEGQLKQLLARLFPFDQRGLTHSYWAPNCWVFYNLADKVMGRVLRREGVARMTGGLVEEAGFSVLPRVTPLATLCLVILAMLPALQRLWRHPHPRLFLPTVAYCLMCSFMLGWHVHEKAILMVTLPLSMLCLDGLSASRLSFFLTAAGTFTLLPLLHQPNETPIKLLLLTTHTLLSWVLLSGEWRGRQKARRIRFDALLGFGPLCFLALAAPVQLLVSVVQPLLLTKWAFLPLMAVSLYGAVANIYAWALCFQQTTHVLRFLDVDDKDG